MTERCSSLDQPASYFNSNFGPQKYCGDTGHDICVIYNNEHKNHTDMGFMQTSKFIGAKLMTKLQ